MLRKHGGQHSVHEEVLHQRIQVDASNSLLRLNHPVVEYPHAIEDQVKRIRVPPNILKQRLYLQFFTRISLYRQETRALSRQL